MSRVYDFGLGGQFPDSSTKFLLYPNNPIICRIIGIASFCAGYYWDSARSAVVYGFPPFLFRILYRVGRSPVARRLAPVPIMLSPVATVARKLMAGATR